MWISILSELTFKKFSLKSYMQICTSEKLFSCKVCGLVCYQHTNLIKHIKQYFFTMWGSAFPHYSNLKTYGCKHTVEEPYLWEVFGWAFSISSSLKIPFPYIYTYTGEKQFSCQICGSTFSSISTVKSHMGKHRRERPL